MADDSGKLRPVVPSSLLLAVSLRGVDALAREHIGKINFFLEEARSTLRRAARSVLCSESLTLLEIAHGCLVEAEAHRQCLGHLVEKGEVPGLWGAP